jgi:flagellum-specific peptidoglycan hydrolase FlgJ
MSADPGAPAFEECFLRVMAATATLRRPPSWAARRRRTPQAAAGFALVLARPRLLVRPLAHLLGLVVLLTVAAIAVFNRTGGLPSQVTEDAAALETAALDTPESALADDADAIDQAVLAQPLEDSTSPQTTPKLRSYTVQEGDTLSIVAASFALTNETLIWANELADPDLLLVGSKLVIPRAVGILHHVRPGDTLADLADFYSSDIQRTIEVNDLEPPFMIVVGERLLLPDGKMPPRGLGESDAQTNEGSTSAASTESARSRPLPYPSGATADQARFILSVVEAARASQRDNGIPASVSIAQAILESFWGSSRLSREHNNYFGIKAKERPGSAGVTWFNVWEVIGGANVTQRQPFRAYKTMGDSFVDHGRFFHQNWRYAAALAARADPRQFAREINRAGYATDPAYAHKLIGLMDRFNLYAYDD